MVPFFTTYGLAILMSFTPERERYMVCHVKIPLWIVIEPHSFYRTSNPLDK